VPIPRESPGYRATPVVSRVPVAASSSVATSPAEAAVASAPAAPSTPRPLPSTAEITGRWDDLVERLRTAGKPMLASALAHTTPASIAATGLLVLELDEPNDIYAHAIHSARADVLSSLRDWFPSLARVELRSEEQSSSPPPKRLTDEMIRAERIASLRKRDPVLSAAIDALDLDVTD
jgi:hypothetical protein